MRDSPFSRPRSGGLIPADKHKLTLPRRRTGHACRRSGWVLRTVDLFQSKCDTDAGADNHRSTRSKPAWRYTLRSRGAAVATGPWARGWTRRTAIWPLARIWTTTQDRCCTNQSRGVVESRARGQDRERTPSRFPEDSRLTPIRIPRPRDDRSPKLKEKIDRIGLRSLSTSNPLLEIRLQ